MRVLLCVPAYAPAVDYGGPVTKIGLLAPALQQLGVDVEILTANFGPGRSRVEPGRRPVDGVTVTYLPRIVSRGWLSVSRGVGSAVRSGNFDVVHSFGLRDGLVTAAALAAHRRHIPLVVEPMGMAVPRVRSQRLKAAFDRAARLVTARAAVTIATSELEASELNELGYPNVQLRPNPIVVPTPRPRPAPQYDLCFVGRIHRKKRLDDVIAALVARPTWTAVIAGPDEDGTAMALADAASAQGVADRLTLRAWVDADTKRDLIERSRCFVLPSMTENFGNAAAEAIALGTPAVVTDQCGVATLVKQTGMGRVVPVDTHAVIEAIDDVIAHNADPIEAAAVLVTYAPDTVAAEQLRIYDVATRRV